MARLQINPDRANLAGVTNLDVAAASAVGMNGYQVGTLREGDKQIPIKARLVMGERAQLADLSNLYVYSSQNSNKVPLGLVSSLDYHMENEISAATLVADGQRVRIIPRLRRKCSSFLALHIGAGDAPIKRIAPYHGTQD